MKFNQEKFVEQLKKDGADRVRIHQFKKGHSPSVKTLLKFAIKGGWSLHKVRSLFE